VRLIVRRAVGVALFVSAIAGAVSLFTHGRGADVLDGWLLAIGAVLLLALFRVARLRAPRAASPLDLALQRMRAPDPAPTELALERDITLSRAIGFHFHVRLRPILREIASHRLRANYGVDLDREPARARELVPARAWAVVDPARRPPDDRLAPGPTVAEISAVVDDLETI
jgi:hypothetical protein